MDVLQPNHAHDPKRSFLHQQQQQQQEASERLNTDFHEIENSISHLPSQSAAYQQEPIQPYTEGLPVVSHKVKPNSHPVTQGQTIKNHSPHKMESTGTGSISLQKFHANQRNNLNIISSEHMTDEPMINSRGTSEGGINNFYFKKTNEEDETISRMQRRINDLRQKQTEGVSDASLQIPQHYIEAGYQPSQKLTQRNSQKDAYSYKGGNRDHSSNSPTASVNDGSLIKATDRYFMKPEQLAELRQRGLMSATSSSKISDLYNLGHYENLSKAANQTNSFSDPLSSQEQFPNQLMRTTYVPAQTQQLASMLPPNAPESTGERRYDSIRHLQNESRKTHYFQNDSAPNTINNTSVNVKTGGFPTCNHSKESLPIFRNSRLEIAEDQGNFSMMQQEILNLKSKIGELEKRIKGAPVSTKESAQLSQSYQLQDSGELPRPQHYSTYNGPHQQLSNQHVREQHYFEPAPQAQQQQDIPLRQRRCNNRFDQVNPSSSGQLSTALMHSVRQPVYLSQPSESLKILHSSQNFNPHELSLSSSISNFDKRNFRTTQRVFDQLPPTQEIIHGEGELNDFTLSPTHQMKPGSMLINYSPIFQEETPELNSRKMAKSKSRKSADRKSGDAKSLDRKSADRRSVDRKSGDFKSFSKDSTRRAEILPKVEIFQTSMGSKDQFINLNLNAGSRGGQSSSKIPSMSSHPAGTTQTSRTVLSHRGGPLKSQQVPADLQPGQVNKSMDIMNLSQLSNQIGHALYGSGGKARGKTRPRGDVLSSTGTRGMKIAENSYALSPLHYQSAKSQGSRKRCPTTGLNSEKKPMSQTNKSYTYRYMNKSEAVDSQSFHSRRSGTRSVFRLRKQLKNKEDTNNELRQEIKRLQVRVARGEDYMEKYKTLKCSYQKVLSKLEKVDLQRRQEREKNKQLKNQIHKLRQNTRELETKMVKNFDRQTPHRSRFNDSLTLQTLSNMAADLETTAKSVLNGGNPPKKKKRTDRSKAAQIPRPKVESQQPLAYLHNHLLSAHTQKLEDQINYRTQAELVNIQKLHRGKRTTSVQPTKRAASTLNSAQQSILKRDRSSRGLQHQSTSRVNLQISGVPSSQGLFDLRPSLDGSYQELRRKHPAMLCETPAAELSAKRGSGGGPHVAFQDD